MTSLALALENRSPRERLVLAATQSLREHGYAGTSMRGVAERAHAPWGSMHHYFPGGKPQLALEAVRYSDEVIRGMIRDSLRSTSSPHKALRAFFDQALTGLESGDFRLGCPIASIGVETLNGDERLTAACRDAVREWQSLLAEGLRERGIPARHARAIASAAITQYEGALMLSRLERDLGPMRTAAELIVRALDSGDD